MKNLFIHPAHAISVTEPSLAISPLIQNMIWDFLFYALFGVVITSSVGVAGILLVFSFLVVPALISMQLTDNITKQLILGWIIGVLLCLVGMFLSYTLDLPAGAILVVVFTIVPILGLPLLSMKQSR